MNKLVIGLGALVLILASALVTVIATGMFSKGGNAAQEVVVQEVKVNPFEAVQYLQLEPEFIVNFGANAKPKYLMIDVSASTKEEAAVAALKQHMPVIRDKLLTLFGEQKAAELKTAEAKEKLRGEALACIQSVMEERYGSTGVDEVLFTRFVMQ